MRECVRDVAIATFHRLGGDQRVPDCLAGGLNCCLEEGIDRDIVYLHAVQHDVSRFQVLPVVGSPGAVGARIRKGDQDIAGTVSPNPSSAGQTEHRPVRDPPELAIRERGIGRDGDDDRAILLEMALIPFELELLDLATNQELHR